MSVSVYIQYQAGEDPVLVLLRTGMEEPEADEYFTFWNDACEELMKRGVIADYQIAAVR